MNKIFILSFALLFNSLNIIAVDGIFEQIKHGVQDAFTGPFAIHVYKGVAVATGVYIAKQAVDPLFFKLKYHTNLLSIQEQHTLLALRRENSAFTKQEFEINATKRTILKDEFPEYKEQVDAEIETVRNSDLSDQEKHEKIDRLQKQLKDTELKLRLVLIKSYNQMVNATSF
jgi:hypothetical protein